MACVIELDEHRPHYAGACSCLKCKHEWTGVAPIDTVTLECPACHGMSGVKFSAREVRLAQALESVATGRALGENSRINWDICRDVARKALAAEKYGNYK